jgi:hypothetical protein
VIRFFGLLLTAIFFLNYSFAQTNADSSIKGKDSLAKPGVMAADTVAGGKGILRDSAVSIKDSVMLAIQNPGTPGSSYLNKEILGDNPYFLFFAKPQYQLMQPRNPPSKDYLFYLMLALLLYYGLLRVSFEKYINNLFLLFFRTSLRQQQLREQLLQTPLASLLLNILFVISAGLYGSFLVDFYHVAQIKFPLLFGFCSGAILALYLAKFALLKLCGWIFNIARATEIYIFIVFLVNKMTGILLLPFLIILAFSSNNTINSIAITVSLVMIALLFVYRFSTAFKNIRNEIKLSLFHFFIYLCTFEITPLVLIYRVLLAYLEKAS